MKKNIKILILGIVLCVGFLIANNISASYKFNPYTRLRDYYEGAVTTSTDIVANSIDVASGTIDYLQSSSFNTASATIGVCTFPIIDGNADDVMTTDGLGVITWNPQAAAGATTTPQWTYTFPYITPATSTNVVWIQADLNASSSVYTLGFQYSNSSTSVETAFKVVGLSDLTGFDSSASSTIDNNLQVTGTLQVTGQSTTTGLAYFDGGFDVNASSTVSEDFSVKRFFTSPDTIQNVATSGETILSSFSYIDLNPDTDYVLNATPTVATGTDGQLLILHNISTFTLDFQDESNLNGSSIYHGGTDGVLGPEEILTLIFDEDHTNGAGWRTLSHPNLQSAGGAAEALQVRNVSGVSIGAGKAVYATGFNTGQNRITIDLADADDPTKMPAIGITIAVIANGANGEVIISGGLMGIDTSAFLIDALVYVDTTAGELTAARPTIDSIQKMGEVLRSNANNGIILVTGAGRVNDVPHIFASDQISATTSLSVASTSPETAFVVADATSTLYTLRVMQDLDVATGTLFVDASNGYVGISTTTPSEKLDIQGNLRVDGNASTSGTLSVGNYTFPTADGTNTQVLTTNGSGVLTWNAQSGGGATTTPQWTYTSPYITPATSTNDVWIQGDLNASSSLFTQGIQYSNSSTSIETALRVVGIPTFTADLVVEGTASSTFAGDLEVTDDLLVDEIFVTTAVDFPANSILEGDILFSTACASGNHYYLNGNDLACEADENTIYTAGGTLLDLTTGTFSINEGTLTDERICEYELTGTQLECTLVKDGSGDCASGAVCLGDHTHSQYLLLTGGALTGDLSIADSLLVSGNSTTTGDATTTNFAVLGSASTSDSLYVNDDRIIGYESRCFGWASSTEEDDNVTVFRPQQDITVSSSTCETTGGTSVVMTLSDGTNSMPAITCLPGQTSSIGSLSNNTWNAYEKMELDTGTVTGEVDWFLYCIYYSFDK